MNAATGSRRASSSSAPASAASPAPRRSAARMSRSPSSTGGTTTSSCRSSTRWRRRRCRPPTSPGRSGACCRATRTSTSSSATSTGVDMARAARAPRGTARTLPFDRLVFAAGSNYNYFGHDDWAEAAPGPRSIEDARTIRARLLLAFEHAEIATDPAEQARLLTTIIVGGGPTGVEMAGSVVELARHTLVRDFRRIDPAKARVLLVEGGPRLLPSLPGIALGLHQDGAGAARRHRHHRGDGRGDRAARGDDRRPRRAGRLHHLGRGRPCLAGGGLPRRAGRPRRPRHGRRRPCRSRPRRGLCHRRFRRGARRGRQAAAGARPGRQPGGLASRPGAPPQPRARARRCRPFRYSSRGNTAIVGRNAAVFDFGWLRLKGRIGWFFWAIVHIYLLTGFENRALVAIHWLWMYLTYQRGARLITGGEAEERRLITPPPASRSGSPVPARG